MQSLLNLGLNFSVLPLKLDINQVLVDFNQFERSDIWHEFWYGREKDKNYKAPIFKVQKRSLPKNFKKFLSAIKSEILDPRNRNQSKCNLSPEQISALKELIKRFMHACMYVCMYVCKHPFLKSKKETSQKTIAFQMV